MEGRKRIPVSRFYFYSSVRDSWTHLERAVEALDLGDLSNRFVRVFGSLLDSPVPLSLGRIEVSLARARLLLGRISSAHQRILHQALAFHSALCHFTLVASRILLDLYSKGFCVDPPEDENDAGNEERGEEMAGMGEGEGARDVTNEMETEAQLLGEHGELDDLPPPSRQDAPEEGAEMEVLNSAQLPFSLLFQAEFEGQMHDLNLDDLLDEDEGSEEKEEAPNELDQEMGEVDGQNEERLDAKMHDEEDKEEQRKELSDVEEHKQPHTQPQEQELAANEDDLEGKEAQPSAPEAPPQGLGDDPDAEENENKDEEGLGDEDGGNDGGEDLPQIAPREIMDEGEEDPPDQMDIQEDGSEAGGDQDNNEVEENDIREEDGSADALPGSFPPFSPRAHLSTPRLRCS